MNDDLLTRNYFLVNVHGQIEGAVFPGESHPSVYCKCLFKHGPDWAMVGEDLEKSKEKIFISQLAHKSEDERQLYTWNLPLEVTFKSTNIFGWPQIVGNRFEMTNKHDHIFINITFVLQLACLEWTISEMMWCVDMDGHICPPVPVNTSFAFHCLHHKPPRCSIESPVGLSIHASQSLLTQDWQQETMVVHW